MTVTAAKSHRSLRSSRAGSAAIEFGIAVPMLAILVVGVAEVGFAAYQAMQVQSAVEAGAFYAAQNGANAAGITAAVLNATNLTSIAVTPAPAPFYGCPTTTGVTTVTNTATCPDGSPPGQYVRITAVLTRKSLIPNSGMPLPATFTAQAIVRLS